MATLTDRPNPQAQTPTQTPARPPAQPPPPGPPGGRPPIGPNRRRDRLRALLYLFGPFAGLCVVVLAVVIAGVVISLSSSEGPATGAAELVPGNALIYVHVSTDSSRSAVGRTLALSRRLPGSPVLFSAVTDQVDAMLSGSANSGVSFDADVRPWLGKEAALAVLDTTRSQAGSLMVLDVRNHAAARRFLARVGARPDGRFRGIQLLAQPSGAVLAFVRHYLVLGQAASVEAAIFVAQGGAPSLANSPGYEQAASTEPDGRVLDAY